MDRIDAERDFVCTKRNGFGQHWISYFNSIGLFLPIIERIWDEWWSLNSPGKAIAAVKYASGLIYLKGENPIFSSWTPEIGGGGPYLSEWDATCFDRAWLPENLSFLERRLTADYVVEKLAAITGVGLNRRP